VNLIRDINVFPELLNPFEGSFRGDRIPGAGALIGCLCRDLNENVWQNENE
jgi:hypothetical protein